MEEGGGGGGGGRNIGEIFTSVVELIETSIMFTTA